MNDQPRRQRPPRRAQVREIWRVTPHMIRVVLGGPGLDGFAVGEYTDHYVKLFFPPVGADYDHPLDVEAIQAERPRHEWPVTRTYTVRAWDAERGELTLDFVYHGDEGIAGPWAANAQPGDEISLLGPGGGYAPDPDADWHLFIGDESALPAIAVALEQLPPSARAVAVIEVAGADEEQSLATGAVVDVTWVHRDAAIGPVGDALLASVRSAVFPEGRVHAFVHGDAGSVREIRRHLRADRGLDREAMSVSGYWRRGRDDEAWRAEKGEWKVAVEHDDEALAPG